MTAKMIAMSCCLAAGAASHACCGVAPNPFDVQFGRQENIIIWDPATKTEHFIRRANFKSKNKEFGFIAPTPTVPELGEVEDEAFDVASKNYDAYEKAKRDAELMPNMSCGRAKGESADAGEAKLEVLQQIDLAGYRATTIRARDAKAFRAWLASNNFKTEASIEKWINFYVKKDWVFTSFIVKPVDDVVETSPVRMSFKTERPFAPFYVPKVNQGLEDGSLSIAFYGSGAYEGEHPEVRSSYTTPVREDFAQELSRATGVTNLPKFLGVTSVSIDPWPLDNVTDDLYFRRVGNVPRWPVNLNPAKPYVGAAILGLVAYRVVRRAKAKA